MIEHIAEIVAAYVGKNRVDPSEFPALILKVSQSLADLGKAGAGPPTSPTPAVSIRRSVGADTITCLGCAWSGRMLKRHLSTAHGMTPEAYRALPSDYPMVPRNYSARRSELAKALGLGRRRG
jgi:predicted transcriptional regulator